MYKTVRSHDETAPYDQGCLLALIHHTMYMPVLHVHARVDKSKFGYRMLEKMGWKEGKGLGAEEGGSTEHIPVQQKDNLLGE